MIPPQEPRRRRLQRVRELCQRRCRRNGDQEVEMIRLPVQINQTAAARGAPLRRDPARLVDHRPGQDRATALRDQNHIVSQLEYAFFVKVNACIFITEPFFFRMSTATSSISFRLYPDKRQQALLDRKHTALRTCRTRRSKNGSAPGAAGYGSASPTRRRR